MVKSDRSDERPVGFSRKDDFVSLISEALGGA
jgi:hypothetical protein